MSRLIAAIGGFLGVVGLLLLFLLVNGGYVYRTECPRAGGSTEREWTYRWHAVIPYVGYERTGCESHTATRLALDGVGLWTLEDDGPGPAAQADHSSEYPPADVEALIDNCVQSGRSRSYCECAVGEVTIRVSRDDVNRVAEATRQGEATFAALPADLRQRVNDAAVAAERDCD